MNLYKWNLSEILEEYWDPKHKGKLNISLILMSHHKYDIWNLLYRLGGMGGTPHSTEGSDR